MVILPVVDSWLHQRLWVSFLIPGGLSLFPGDRSLALSAEESLPLRASLGLATTHHETRARCCHLFESQFSLLYKGDNM